MSWVMAGASPTGGSNTNTAGNALNHAQSATAAQSINPNQNTNQIGSMIGTSPIIGNAISRAGSTNTVQLPNTLNPTSVDRGSQINPTSPNGLDTTQLPPPTISPNPPVLAPINPRAVSAPDTVANVFGENTEGKYGRQNWNAQ